MEIKLSEELIFNSHKTLSGRGVNVHVTGGVAPLLSHGTYGSTIAHLSIVKDGLIDVVMGSTRITISNNHFHTTMRGSNSGKWTAATSNMSRRDDGGGEISWRFPARRRRLQW
ncbi:hypothetical protein HAX54_032623 [Datura stramonium]|uniref:Uncharacterized protein n=1 Tax=Datura stramonium TaxID=4076 RepID=A0ABS8VDG9_DATST|nr:hypothetical protein [Datura stramonium]